MEALPMVRGAPPPTIFLDIDGVLNHSKASGEWPLLDEECIQRFRWILAQTGAEVVLSSTWRLYPPMLATVVERVCPLIGETPNITGSRGLQIHAWLVMNPDRRARHAVIDDDRDMVDGLNVFYTQWDRGGLTDEIAQAVVDHLMGEGE